MSGIFDRLKDIFSTGALPEQPLPELDAAHALAALLVRVAKADDMYLFEELEQIDRILAERFGLNAVEAARLRAESERLEKAIPETPRFAEMVRGAIEYDERLSVVKAMWKVAQADGIRKESEISLVHLVEELLGISETHSREAREAAQVIP